jgi:hypothetical protein
VSVGLPSLTPWPKDPAASSCLQKAPTAVPSMASRRAMYRSSSLTSVAALVSMLAIFSSIAAPDFASIVRWTRTRAGGTRGHGRWLALVHKREGTAVPEPERVWGEARRWTATSVVCPACGAKISQPCPGQRVHQERLDVVLELARSNELAPLADGEAAPVGSTNPRVRTRPPGRPRRWNDSGAGLPVTGG